MSILQLKFQQLAVKLFTFQFLEASCHKQVFKLVLSSSLLSFLMSTNYILTRVKILKEVITRIKDTTPKSPFVTLTLSCHLKVKMRDLLLAQK